MPLFPVERYTGRVRQPSAEHRRVVFAASVLLHSAAVFWLMTSRTTMLDGDEEPPPLMTIDLARREPEVATVPENRTIAQVGSSDSPDTPKQGGGGGQPAHALLARPTNEPARLEIPVPAVVLEVPLAVPLPAAPVTGPTLVGSSGTGEDPGTGEEVGNGSGEGSGSGAGSGKGDGEGTGRGGVLRRAGSGAGLLQPAEWIVRPTDEKMRYFYPWDARQQGVSGTARLSCRVKSKRARDCKVLSESPKGFGFGESAMAAVRTGWIKAPVIGDQNPEKVRVSVEISFDWTK